MKAKWFSTLLVLTLLLVSVVPVLSAAPQPPVEDLGPLISSSEDDAPHPLGTAQREAKEVAIDATLHGKSDGDRNHHTHKVGLKHYVELDRLGKIQSGAIAGMPITQIWVQPVLPSISLEVRRLELPVIGSATTL